LALGVFFNLQKPTRTWQLVQDGVGEELLAELRRSGGHAAGVMDIARAHGDTEGREMASQERYACCCSCAAAAVEEPLPAGELE
jgi:hypothetical protein